MFILQWTVSSMKTRTVIVLFNSTHSLLTNTSLSEGLENIFERIDFINFINYAKVMYQKYLPITRILRARMPHFLWLEVKEERDQREKKRDSSHGTLISSPHPAAWFSGKKKKRREGAKRLRDGKAKRKRKQVRETEKEKTLCSLRNYRGTSLVGQGPRALCSQCREVGPVLIRELHPKCCRWEFACLNWGSCVPQPRSTVPHAAARSGCSQINWLNKKKLLGLHLLKNPLKFEREYCYLIGELIPGNIVSRMERWEEKTEKRMKEEHKCILPQRMWATRA